MALWMGSCLTNGTKRTMRTLLEPIESKTVSMFTNSLPPTPLPPPVNHISHCLCPCVFPLHTDSGLGHVTCGCQWDISKDDRSKGFKSACVLGFSLLGCFPEITKQSRSPGWKTTWRYSWPISSVQLQKQAQVRPVEQLCSQPTESCTIRNCYYLRPLCLGMLYYAAKVN